MNRFHVKLSPEGTWECSHVSGSRESAPPTRLSLNQATEQTTGVDFRFRGMIRCPDCATLWRVWPRDRIAKPLIERNNEMRLTPAKYQHAPVLDIYRIIARVANIFLFQNVIVVQNGMPLPHDDEGLWVFRLPGIANDIQIESPTGICPFTIEDDSMRESVEMKSGSTVESVANEIIEYLGSQKMARHESILAQIVFLPTSEGGRKTAPMCPGHPWMHLVQQDRDVRVTAKDASNSVDVYHSVVIAQWPNACEFGVPAKWGLLLGNFPQDQYEDFQRGKTFTVREGAKVVGHGVVLERTEKRPADSAAGKG